MAALLTYSAQAWLASLVMGYDAHLAWGSGDPAWPSNPDLIPAPSLTATALEAEVGRRQATTVSYCLPDNLGPIETPEGNFSATETPSPHLYFRFSFEPDEAVGQTIREWAIFLGTTKAAGVSPGKFYLTPAEVDDPGQLLVIERGAPIVRAVTTRQFFDLVVRL